MLWKQIIEYAKRTKKPIIFITDERKINWWWKLKDGRNMGPRQELVEEIQNEANVSFHMYSSERFLTYGLSYLEEQVNKKTLEEIQEMTKSEIQKTKSEISLLSQSKNLDHELNVLASIIDDETETINKLKYHIEDLRPEIPNDPEIRTYIKNITIQLDDLVEERNGLIHRYKELENKNSLVKRKYLGTSLRKMKKL